MAVTTRPAAFTWAISGTTVAPTLGKQASGWAFKEMPPSSMQNWLQQQGGHSATFIATNFTDVAGFDALKLGCASAGVGLRASDDGTTAVFHFDGSDGGIETRVRSDEAQVRTTLYLGGAPGSSSTLELTSSSPGAVGAPGADAQALLVQSALGSVRTFVGADVLRPRADDSDLAASGVPLDAGISLTNFVKAFVRFRVQYTTAAAVSAPPAISSNWNVTSGSYDTPSNTYRFPVDAADAGTIQGVVLVAAVTSGGSAGVLPRHLKVTASYNVGAKRIEVQVESYRSSAPAGWKTININSGSGGPDHDIDEYITLMLL